MRKFVGTFATITFIALGISFEANSRVTAITAIVEAKALGGEDGVLPFDHPLPFPWNSIEGIWEVEGRKFNALFSFEVMHDCESRTILRVLQIDPRTRQPVAQGIGYYNEKNSQVFAGMSVLTGTTSYMLFVGAYKDTHADPPRSVVGLRITPIGDWTHLQDFRLYKVQASAAKVPSSGATCMLKRSKY